MANSSGLLGFLNRVAGPPPVNRLPALYSPSNRLPILQVLESVLDPKIEPRQPHDDIQELLAESHIARSVFDHSILPILTDILSARRPEIGPEKNPIRAEDKVIAKLKLSDDEIDEYKASGKIHFGLNCDYTRSMSSVGTMRFVERSSDMFQGRGIVTINKGDGSKPLNIVVLDVENGFIEEVPHKKNLMRINLKLAVPITLKDGTETYHVLEHKILLKASVKNEKDGCNAWAEYRTHKETSRQLDRAFKIASEDSAEPILEKYLEAWSLKTEWEKRRSSINARDHTIKGIHALMGYKPESRDGSVRGISWSFTPMAEVVAEMKSQKTAKLLPIVSQERAFA